MEQTWAERVAATEAIHTMRRILVRLLEQRFGALPEGTKRRIESLESRDELDRLLDQVLQVKSLEELGLTH